MTFLLVIGILVLLIVVHELGHFAAAKLFRVKVEEFGVGYPPKAFTFGTYGGTEYTLNWLPFGGFVRLFGENEEAPGKRGSFSSAPRIVQAVILLAGVFMNAVAGWLLFAGALTAGVPHQVSSSTADASSHLLITMVLPETPAALAGLVAGDEIVRLKDPKEEAVLTPEGVVAFVGERGGKEIEVSYKRGEEERSTMIFPAHAVVPSEADRPAIGVKLALVSSAPIPFLEALQLALPIAFDKLSAIFVDIKGMIVKAFQGAPALQDVVGPVGLVSVVGSAAEHGPGSVLILAGFISLNLAIINLVPIPALDGGRLVLLAIEAVVRREAARPVVQALNFLGIVAVALLMITVTYNDIVRLFN